MNTPLIAFPKKNIDAFSVLVPCFFFLLLPASCFKLRALFTYFLRLQALSFMLFALISVSFMLLSPASALAESGSPYGYDPLQGATYRANLMRDGNYRIKNAPALTKEKWKFKTKEAIKASPVLVDDTVFIGSSDGFFYAIDCASGKEKWKFKTGGPIYASATVYGGKVFFVSMDAKVYALDAKTGEKKWEKSVESENKYHLISPGVAYGIVFVSQGVKCDFETVSWGGSKLIGLDVETGDKVWEQNEGTGPDCFSSMAIIDGKLIMDTSWNYDSLLDLKSGIFDWKKRGTGRPLAGHYYSTHAYCDGMIYGLIAVGGDSSGNSRMAQIVAFDKAGKNTYTIAPYDKFKEGTSKPADGKDHRGWGAPCIADNTVFLGLNDGILYTFDAKTGKRGWTFQAGAAIKSSPSFGNGTLYFACDDGNLYALDAKTGSEKAKFNLGGKTVSSPCLGEGTLYIGADDGNLYAIE